MSTLSEPEITERDLAELKDIKAMIETPGWVAFSRRFKEQAADLRMNSWNTIKTADQLHYLKGFIEATEAVANYENVVAAAEQQAQPSHEDNALSS